jgi:threonine aldolase
MNSRQRAFAASERFLSGHGPRRVRAALERLLAEADSDEMADLYGSGAVLEELEAEVALLLGKPAAVFMPSGTMAQQIALRIHADRARCRTVAFHPTSHLELHEQRGYAHLHRLDARLVGRRDRLLAREDLEAIAEPIAALLLELPQREIGGRLPTWDELTSQLGWAGRRGVPVHLDGARLWETAPFYRRGYSEIAGRFDSVYVSFYKILNGIAGALLAGSAEFIAEARVWLRRAGGNLVALYPFAIAARAGMRDHLHRMAEYHDRAVAVAALLASFPGVRVIPDPPHTNMMHAFLPGDAERLLEASAALAERERVAVFTATRPCDVPGYAAVEIAIGSAAAAIDDAELGRWFEEILAAGAR